jgi:hypothetical protein
MFSSIAMPLHPIQLPDGRVPCDCCDAAITTTEAERNHVTWAAMLCDDCAAAYAEANPDHNKEPA